MKGLRAFERCDRLVEAFLLAKDHAEIRPRRRARAIEIDRAARVTFGDIAMTLVDLARNQARKTMQVVRVRANARSNDATAAAVFLRTQNRCGAEMRRPIVGTQAGGAPHRVQRLVQFAGPHARPAQFHVGVGVARVTHRCASSRQVRASMKRPHANNVDPRANSRLAIAGCGSSARLTISRASPNRPLATNVSIACATSTRSATDSEPRDRETSCGAFDCAKLADRPHGIARSFFRRRIRDESPAFGQHHNVGLASYGQGLSEARYQARVSQNEIGPAGTSPTSPEDSKKF